MIIPSHRELTARAEKWLRDEMECPIVLSNPKVFAGENPDVIGFYDGGESFLIECKVSKQDFSKDKEKVFRRDPDEGMGFYRYYAVPDGLLQENKSPLVGWGLLVFGEGVEVAAESRVFEVRRNDLELSLLVAAIRNGRIIISSENKNIIVGNKKLSFIDGQRRYPKYKDQRYEQWMAGIIAEAKAEGLLPEDENVDVFTSEQDYRDQWVAEYYRSTPNANCLIF